MIRRSRRRTADLAQRAAFDDARHLALELAAGHATHPIDAMSLGLVLEPDEIACRYLGATITQFDPCGRQWPPPAVVGLLVTDHRVLVRQSHGAVVSLWWAGLVAIEADLNAGWVVLDLVPHDPTFRAVDPDKRQSV